MPSLVLALHEEIAALARSQGVHAYGPVSDPSELPGVLAEAVKVVRNERRPVVVDVVCAAPE
ncbi:hypothetical protein [Phytoactinopolyspora limicola]|uniref:hypothetical protein n=1 Tax=Phytoactinopolyspora limicola TaxID=2715536 RepID=UPI001407A66E|nr:hypothetical protein [Phytoactinopolyspora limicola]